ncbi:GNAT family N-acetyltransferase [Nonomuraea sp. NPDC003804]|uniref:GNAT family N-acetyltransferase n=1 Tax=Nonomuraea sp. NPDC003804 TaxID=3154547 RepID=UPI0033B37255
MTTVQVEVRELHRIDEFADVFRLFDEIWHPDPANPPVTVELMRVLSHTGSYVAGAYEGDRLVGASVGILAAGNTLHSHVTGAAQGGRGIGQALKAHQRDWCARRGIDRITWTFDPLVRRNAYFNLAKLGARPVEYVENFYGPMADAINEGDESDRLVVEWPVKERAPAREPYEGVVALEEEDRLPVRGAVKGPVALVGTPADIEALRREDPSAAVAWRLAMREVLGGLMAEGGQVVAFTGNGEYVVLARLT